MRPKARVITPTGYTRKRLYGATSDNQSSVNSRLLELKGLRDALVEIDPGIVHSTRCWGVPTSKRLSREKMSPVKSGMVSDPPEALRRVYPVLLTPTTLRATRQRLPVHVTVVLVRKGRERRRGTLRIEPEVQEDQQAVPEASHAPQSITASPRLAPGTPRRPTRTNWESPRSG